MGADGFRWTKVIAELERVFETLGMKQHAAELARFKASYQKQSQKLANTPNPPWTTETLVELARVF